MANNRIPADLIPTLERLFEEHTGTTTTHTQSLSVSGSDRRYFRISSNSISAIATYNANVAENNSFFYFAGLLRKHGVNVPEVYKIGPDRRSYLQEDLGNTTLFDLVAKEGFTDRVKGLYHKAMEQLARAQWIAGREADYKQCFASRQFDERAIMSDLLYFKYYFADLQGVQYDRSLLISEMEAMSKDIGHIQPHTLMYRDFQSRNIMVHNGDVWLIDFQGAMQGAPQYDIASLLWQARAQLPQQLKDELLHVYMRALGDLNVPRMDEIYFRKGYLQFVLVRLLQVLGAYGFRGLLQRKAHFIASIGPALKNLESFLANHPHLPAYPELRKLLERLSSKEMLDKYILSSPPTAPKLEVQICSFSYKGGIPKTSSPHGGGFVFDCRGILNPGRFDGYKHLTGNDDPVKQFLERETRMPEFLEHVFATVSINVDDYLARGFNQLMVSFGCTGGQHRSVYAANQLAQFLRSRYNIQATVAHLNEKKWVLGEQ